MLLEPQLQAISGASLAVPVKRGRGLAASRATAQGCPLAGVTFNLVGGTAEAVLSEVANIRERFIKRVLRKVMVFEIAPEIIQRILDGDQRRGGLVLPPASSASSLTMTLTPSKICSWSGLR